MRRTIGKRFFATMIALVMIMTFGAQYAFCAEDTEPGDTTGNASWEDTGDVSGDADYEGDVSGDADYEGDISGDAGKGFTDAGTDIPSGFYNVDPETDGTLVDYWEYIEDAPDNERSYPMGPAPLVSPQEEKSESPKTGDAGYGIYPYILIVSASLLSLIALRKQKNTR